MYLKCDALLLADVFEKFRNSGLNNYGLCPSHAMVSMTTVELKLVSDTDIYLFFEKIWEMKFLIFLKSFDLKQEWKQITYLDANNLYGCDTVIVQKVVI